MKKYNRALFKGLEITPMDLVSGSTAGSLFPLINCLSFLCHNFDDYKMRPVSAYIANKWFSRSYLIFKNFNLPWQKLIQFILCIESCLLWGIWKIVVAGKSVLRCGSEISSRCRVWCSWSNKLYTSGVTSEMHKLYPGKPREVLNPTQNAG